MLLWKPDTCLTGHVPETYDTERSTMKINHADHVQEILKLAECKCNPCSVSVPFAQLMTLLSQTHTDTIKPSLWKIQHTEWDKHSSIILLLQLMIGSHDCENMVCWNRWYCSLHLHRYHTVWKLWVHKMPLHVELKEELKNYTVEMPADRHVQNMAIHFDLLTWIIVVIDGNWDWLLLGYFVCSECWHCRTVFLSCHLKQILNCMNRKVYEKLRLQSSGMRYCVICYLSIELYGITSRTFII